MMQHGNTCMGTIVAAAKESDTFSMNNATYTHMRVESSGNEWAVQVANIVSTTAAVFWMTQGQE